VLGMHRSGTSALSGSLSLLGYGLPATLAPADQSNRQGYFESKALWDVNDELLAKIGSGWNDWTPVDLSTLPASLYQSSLKRATDILRAEYKHCDGPMILKDPRMCRLMPLWLDALARVGFAPHVVHTHRHPLEVAASLHRRDGYDPAFGLLMWLRHVLDAEHATRKVPRCFTSFDLLMQDRRGTLETIHQRLDLPLPPSKVSGETPAEGFLSTELRHFNVTTAAAPAELDLWWQNSYDILEKWALTGEASEDYDRLDEIRSELAALPPQVLALVRSGQLALIDCMNQAGSLDRTRTELATKEAEVLRLRDDIQDRDRSLETRTQTLDQLRADNAQLHQNLARAEADYQTLLQSSSWRMTAPLRHVVGRLRRDPKSS